MAPTLRKTAAASIVAVALLTGLQASAVKLNTPVTPWNPPLDPPVHLVNQYRQPNSDYSAGHRGLDYLVELDQPVLAPADGEVWFAGKVVDRNVLSLSHQGGYLSSYEPVCTDLMKGEPVFAGQEIGVICEADVSYAQHCSDATCMHFSLRYNGAYLSPLVFIGKLNPSRLLPMLADGHSGNPSANAQ